MRAVGQAPSAKSTLVIVIVAISTVGAFGSWVATQTCAGPTTARGMTGEGQVDDAFGRAADGERVHQRVCGEGLMQLPFVRSARSLMKLQPSAHTVHGSGAGPKVAVTPFDKAVDAKLDASVRRIRNQAAAEAIAFLGAKPVD